MAIQLGLDGGLRLTEANDTESIRQALALTRDKYLAYVRAIDVGESERAVYWRIVFAILSVHSPIEATFEAFKSLRLWRARFGRLPAKARCRDLLLAAKGKDGTVTQYCSQKAGYLVEFDRAWARDKAAFLRGTDTDHDWRLRLVRNVKGLGLAKASFAVALCQPVTSDVCCIDTHMYALLTDGRPPKGAIGKRIYLELESRIRELAWEVGLSVFATQWALWDARRGQSNPHSVLAAV